MNNIQLLKRVEEERTQEGTMKMFAIGVLKLPNSGDEVYRKKSGGGRQGKMYRIWERPILEIVGISVTSPPPPPDRLLGM